MDFLTHKLFYLLCILTALQCLCYAEETDLSLFLEQEKADLLWDPVSETGIITKYDSEVVFKLGIPWIVCDYTEKYAAGGIKREKGIILFPEHVTNIIHEYFTQKETAPRIAVILLDPGHGGKDPGAYYIHSVEKNSGDKKTKEKITLYEKDLTLKVSMYLYEMLKKAYGNKNIILTRSKDEYLKLEERVDIANSFETGENEAIVYISIHFNASFNKNAKGFEVWYLPQDYRRNLIDDEEVPEDEKEIIPILNTLLEEEYTLESITLAKAISEGLSRQVGDMTEERGLKEESWFVVRNAKMPSVLLELGFISNKDEAVLLNQDSYLKKLARGVYNGICTFITQFENTKGFTE